MGTHATTDSAWASMNTTEEIVAAIGAGEMVVILDDEERAIRDTVQKALGMAEGMTYKGVHPTATLIETAYPIGVRLTKKQMQPYEACLQRLAGLGKWFVTITAAAANGVCSPARL